MNKNLKDWYNKKALSQPDTMVLYIGCSFPERVIGIDIAEEVIKRAPVYHTMDASEMTFNKNLFDRIEAIGSLEYIKDISKVFNEVYRVLKPKGIFIFTLQRYTWWIEWYRNHLRPYNPKDAYFNTQLYTLFEIRYLLEYSGLHIDKADLISYRTICKIYAYK